MEDWVFTYDFGYETLLKHFQTNSLKGFGIESLQIGIVAAGTCLQYLKETEHHQTQHINKISRLEEDRYVWLDRFTIRNLELFYSPHDQAKTLLDILDLTVSPMGSRLLKRWLALPLKDAKAIENRLDAVDNLVNNEEHRNELRDLIHQMGDLERLISKVAVKRVNPREVLQLQKALELLTLVKEQCDTANNHQLKKYGEQINLCTSILKRISDTIKDDAPNAINKGNVIEEGVDEELDDLRKIAFSSKDYLLQLQQKESETTGIPSLKIAFNNVFGYYFEVRNTHKDKVPTEWIRKQTLVNAERYITEELKEYEQKILGAEEKIQVIENRIFNELIEELIDYVEPIQLNAQVISAIDCLQSFAALAVDQNYSKPEINDSLAIEIQEGRHPVIEQQLPLGEEYVSNNVYLNNGDQQIIMITGPNMSGKSALLRQTALITLMAQIGSFVPAQHAKIGLVDKIFTRVGASDNISMGESTFMVEMNETASILNNLSERSLILLDEIGRGTSTYDGISIAWAIARYIHQHPTAPKTLFATHYHELNEMAETFERIANFNVSIREVNQRIIFLRKLVEGGSNHSFGIHVAKLAGMPQSVIEGANTMLRDLENHERKGSSSTDSVQKVQKNDEMQLSFFQLDDPTLMQIKDELLKTDINTLTPVEALMKLNEIKKMVSGNNS
jgi:DNA mismatch repair protein MutS